jgi:hypothetical protein
MRTTVTLDDDVAAEIARRRRQRGIGVSEALNELARAGMTPPVEREAFSQTTVPLGLRIDVDDVAEALERLDDPTDR